MNLTDINNSYLIISGDKIEDIMSILYAKEYQIIQLQTYYKNTYGNAVLAVNSIDNDTLRNDCIFILDHFKKDSCIIKYSGEETVKKIKFDGSEELLSLSMYNTDDDKISYIYNGVSFSFIDQTRYWKPKSKEDLKKGMVVEYLNKDKWHTRTVENPVLEYNNLFKLLMKYDKVRVESVN